MSRLKHMLAFQNVKTPFREMILSFRKGCVDFVMVALFFSLFENYEAYNKTWTDNTRYLLFFFLFVWEMNRCIYFTTATNWKGEEETRGSDNISNSSKEFEKKIAVVSSLYAGCGILVCAYILRAAETMWLSHTSDVQCTLYYTQAKGTSVK